MQLLLGFSAVVFCWKINPARPAGLWLRAARGGGGGCFPAPTGQVLGPQWGEKAGWGAGPACGGALKSLAPRPVPCLGHPRGTVPTLPTSCQGPRSCLQPPLAPVPGRRSTGDQSPGVHQQPQESSPPRHSSLRCWGCPTLPSSTPLASEPYPRPGESPLPLAPGVPAGPLEDVPAAFSALSADLS